MTGAQFGYCCFLLFQAQHRAGQGSSLGDRNPPCTAPHAALPRQRCANALRSRRCRPVGGRRQESLCQDDQVGGTSRMSPKAWVRVGTQAVAHASRHGADTAAVWTWVLASTAAESGLLEQHNHHRVSTVKPGSPSHRQDLTCITIKVIHASGSGQPLSHRSCLDKRQDLEFLNTETSMLPRLEKLTETGRSGQTAAHACVRWVALTDLHTCCGKGKDGTEGNHRRHGRCTCPCSWEKQHETRPLQPLHAPVLKYSPVLPHCQQQKGLKGCWERSQEDHSPCPFPLGCRLERLHLW